MGPNNGSRIREQRCGEDGVASIMTLTTLSLFSLFGLYLAFSSATEARVSDNHASQVQASYAATAGLNHARELLKGLRYDALLRGPDGAGFDNTLQALAHARTYGYRNPVTWSLARSLNILDPASVLESLPDDGLLNTGKIGTADGTVLIPLTGIPFTVPNPNGSEGLVMARYFVKVSDNNGEASELAEDPQDDPYLDGDGTIIIRSMGVARTLDEESGNSEGLNSVAAVEARFRFPRIFEIDSPLLIEGTRVESSQPNMFEGNSFRIDGARDNPGIATIDTNYSDGVSPTEQIANRLDLSQYQNVCGANSSPSVGDITRRISSDPDQSKLLDAAFLYDFAFNKAPTFADTFVSGPITIESSGPYDLGSFDVDKSWNDPAQKPKVTVVRGDLFISGDVTGGGLLVVTGKFRGNGRLRYNGLILVIGEGNTDLSTVNVSLQGALYNVHVVSDASGNITFGSARFNISGNSDLILNRAAIKAGVSLIPPTQISWREIKVGIDP